MPPRPWPGLPAALVSTVKLLTTRAVAFITGPFLAIARGHSRPPEISAPHKMLTKKTGTLPMAGRKPAAVDWRRRYAATQGNGVHHAPPPL